MLIWAFFFLIFFAQAVVGLFIASNYRTILSIPNDIQVWKKASIWLLMLISTPVLPSIVIFKATIYSTNISSIIAHARNTGDSKASELLQEVEDLKEKERIHSQLYSYARAIESTLETYPQLNITLSLLVVDYILPVGFHTELGSILMNTFFLISIPYSIILIITSITNLVNNQKRGSLGLKASAVMAMSYFFQLISSMSCSIFIVVVAQINQIYTWQQSVFLLLLGNILVTWCFTFIFTRKIVSEFSEAPIQQQVFHVLVYTNVTIPYRDIKDEQQRKKSFEIFWHMIFRCIVNMTMVGLVYLILTVNRPRDISSISGHIDTDISSSYLCRLFISVLSACLIFQLLGVS